MSQTNNILEKIKRIVSEKYPSAKIYLYGSRAIGTEHKGSDWPINIVKER